jgi:hypothetical protein
MDMDLALILAFVVTSLFIVVGGIVLFPIARRLGAYLETLALERRKPQAPALQDPTGLQEYLTGVSASLESIEGRLDLIDERQTFLEHLVENRSPERLAQGVAPKDARTPTA